MNPPLRDVPSAVPNRDEALPHNCAERFCYFHTRETGNHKRSHRTAHQAPRRRLLLFPSHWEGFNEGSRRALTLAEFFFFFCQYQSVEIFVRFHYSCDVNVVCRQCDISFVTISCVDYWRLLAVKLLYSVFCKHYAQLLPDLFV